jgi:Icc-related predicted phosphoesterase
MPRLVIISDTHNRRTAVKVPDGDVLVHCGDATVDGRIDEFAKFAKWFLAFPHEIKLFCPGNHDIVAETHRALTQSLLAGAEILIDRAFRHAGLLFYGSPWVPVPAVGTFCADEATLFRKFDLIPQANLDVLITHAPPHGCLDGHSVTLIGHPGASGSVRLGSESLSDRVIKVKPRIHCFGHVHSGYGSLDNGTTQFFNAAICDDKYQPVNAAHVVDIEPREVLNGR